MANRVKMVVAQIRYLEKMPNLRDDHLHPVYPNNLASREKTKPNFKNLKTQNILIFSKKLGFRRIGK
jgi:hypothetical protein